MIVLTASMPNRFRHILMVLKPVAIGKYERKIMVGVLLAITAFIPALGIATISLSTLGNAQNLLANLHRQEVILGQDLKGLVGDEDALMPLFVLTGDRQILNQIRRKEHDFIAVLCELQDMQTPGSYARDILNNIADLAHRRNALAEPGIALKVQNQPVDDVNKYFEQNTSPITNELHRKVEAIVRLVNIRFGNFASEQHRRLRYMSFMLLTACGIAAVLCVGVVSVIFHLLQAKQQHDFSLAQQAQWERALSSARKEAVETAAHDLRNPLQTMMFAAEKLKQVMADEQSVQTSLEAFARSASAMRRVIDTVLDPVNIGAEALSVSKESIDLQPILHDIVIRSYLTAAAKNLDLTYAPARDLPQVVADGSRLEQVFSNLLANAIKFTSAGGRVILTTKWDDAWITVTVADTGCGMSQEQAKNVFKRYWRGGTTPEYGSGLGLAISKTIIDAHDGRIEVNSTSEGTVFVVRLPLR